MSATQLPKRTAEERQRLRPHIAEWFGYRVFPTVTSSPLAIADQRAQRCPFLSSVAEHDISCVKSENSRGVCTISAGSNGPRQDWLVCPHRALDDDLLHSMVRRMFRVGQDDPIHVFPVTALQSETARQRLVDACDTSDVRQYLTFQQLFGGEVALPRGPRNPELSFDATVVEVHSDGHGGIELGRYGVIEVQTTDTHGSYRHAVGALRGALDLHANDFAAQVSAHPEWPGRKVEGPNISNVFKRTFYQVMFKFQITRRASSAGCILALPRPVWDSWQPFLGRPDLIALDDGTHALTPSDPGVTLPAVEHPSWIYVFEIDETPPADGSTTPIRIPLVITTDAPTLSALALDIAPRHAIGSAGAADTVLLTLHRRVRGLMAEHMR